MLISWRGLRVPVIAGALTLDWQGPPVPTGGLFGRYGTSSLSMFQLSFGTVAGTFGFQHRIGAVPNIVNAAPVFTFTGGLSFATLSTSVGGLTWTEAPFARLTQQAAAYTNTGMAMVDVLAQGTVIGGSIFDEADAGDVALADIQLFAPGSTLMCVNEVDLSARQSRMATFARIRASYDQAASAAPYPDWRIGWAHFLQSQDAVTGEWRTIGGTVTFPGGTRDFALASPATNIWTGEVLHGFDSQVGPWVMADASAGLRIVSWYSGGGQSLAAVAGSVSLSVQLAAG
jgi:hypothetical protein